MYYRGTGSRLTQVDISAANLDVSIETGSGVAGALVSSIGALDGTLRGLGTHTLSSQRSSAAALDSARLNIERLGKLGGVVGASMSRLETAGRLLSVEQTMFAAAYGRIADADVAEVAAQSIKQQILLDAGASLLAQANQTPSLALLLLAPPS